MASGWVPVRVVRWPAQEQDREWCAERAIPCLLLVAEGAPVPQEGPTETVLPESTGQEAIAAAVDELAWRPPLTADPEHEPSAARRVRRRQARGPRSLVGVVAAMF